MKTNEVFKRKIVSFILVLGLLLTHFSSVVIAIEDVATPTVEDIIVADDESTIVDNRDEDSEEETVIEEDTKEDYVLDLPNISTVTNEITVKEEIVALEEVVIERVISAPVSTNIELINAIETLTTANPGKQVVILMSNDIDLEVEVIALSEGDNVVIRSETEEEIFTLSSSLQTWHGHIYTGAILTLENMILSGYGPIEGGHGIYLNGGILNVNEGALITNMYFANDDPDELKLGSVILAYNNSIININGGEIRGIYSFNTNETRASSIKLVESTLNFNSGFIGDTNDISPKDFVTELETVELAFNGRAISLFDHSVLNMTGGTIANVVSMFDGGAIYSSNSTVNISGDAVIENAAAANGGAIYATAVSTINISGGTIRYNNSEGNGGSIYSDNSTINMSGGYVISSTVAEYGGGIYAYDSTFTMTGGYIGINNVGYNYFTSEQVGGNGGGVALVNSTATINHGFILGNFAHQINHDGVYHNGFGGGLFLSNSELEFNNGFIFNNHSYNGAGIYVDENSTVTINGGVVGTNFDMLEISGSDIVLTIEGDGTIPNIVDSNSAQNYGGGIYNAGILIINDGNISANHANYGGGIFNLGDLTINDVLISGNIGSVHGGGLFIGEGSDTVINGGTIGIRDAFFAINVDDYFEINEWGEYDLYRLAERLELYELANLIIWDGSEDVYTEKYDENNEMYSWYSKVGYYFIQTQRSNSSGFGGGIFVDRNSTLTMKDGVIGVAGDVPSDLAIVQRGVGYGPAILNGNEAGTGGGIFLHEGSNFNFFGGHIGLEEASRKSYFITETIDYTEIIDEVEVNYFYKSFNTSSFVVGNSAETGGGIAVVNATINSNNAYVNNNLAVRGGGIALLHQNDDSLAYLTTYDLEWNLFKHNLSDLNIVNNVASRFSNQNMYPNGAGVFGRDIELDLNNMHFEGNVTNEGEGAALAVLTSAGEINVNNSTFYNNGIMEIIYEGWFVDQVSYQQYFIPTTEGGAIFLSISKDGDGDEEAFLNIDNSEFKSNIARNGGAIFASHIFDISIVNSKLNDNVSLIEGGALFGINIIVNVNDSEFKNNRTLRPMYSGSGGAISIMMGELYVDNTLFENNISDIGGAIFMAGEWHYDWYYVTDWGAENNILEITNSEFINNLAYLKNQPFIGSGGAIFFLGQNALIEETSFIGNIAYYPLESLRDDTSPYLSGGAIYIKLLEGGEFKIGNNTIFENNSAYVGGAIYFDSRDDLLMGYNGLVIDDTVVFRYNRAFYAYVPNPEIIALYPDIQFETTSIFDHPLNNYDINFVGEFVLEDISERAENTHILTFDPNGGTGPLDAFGSMLVNVETIEEQDILIPGNVQLGFVRPGYRFLGWNRDASALIGDPNYAPDSVIDITEDFVLYAIWIEQITITLDPNGGLDATNNPGVALVLDEVDKGTTLDLNDYATRWHKNNYHLVGWNTSPDGSGTSYPINYILTRNTSMTLYAQWAMNVVDVTFNVTAEGTSQVFNKTLQLPQGSTINANGITTANFDLNTLDGFTTHMAHGLFASTNGDWTQAYTFSGFTSTSGSTFATALENNVTFSGQLTLRRFDVTFIDVEYGLFGVTESVPFGSNLLEPAVNHPEYKVREGYVHLGWFTNVIGTRAEAEAIITADGVTSATVNMPGNHATNPEVHARNIILALEGVTPHLGSTISPSAVALAGPVGALDTSNKVAFNFAGDVVEDANANHSIDNSLITQETVLVRLTALETPTTPGGQTPGGETPTPTTPGDGPTEGVMGATRIPTTGTNHLILVASLSVLGLLILKKRRMTY